MIAFLQFLVAFLMTIAASAIGAPANPGGALVSAAIYVGLIAIGGRFAASLAGQSEEPGAGVAAAESFSNMGRIASLLATWTILVQHGFVRLPELLGVAGVPVVGTAVTLLPFAFFAVATRIALHDACATAGISPRSLVASLLDDARSLPIALAPVAVFAGVIEADRFATRDTAWGRAWIDFAMLPASGVVRALGFGLVAAILVPEAMRRAWRCTPLAAGELRSRLDAFAKRTGLRIRDVLVWPAREDHLNAALLGTVARMRYVVLTRSLVRSFPPHEIEAVFAHEAGHARGRHFLVWMGTIVVFGCLGFGPADLLGPLGPAVAALDPLIRAIGAGVLWFFVVSPWISRRFEREADVSCLETIETPATPPDGQTDGTAGTEHPFVRALARLAAAAPNLAEANGWQHAPTIERLRFIRSYLADERVRRAHRRDAVLLRASLVVLVAGLGFFAVTSTLSAAEAAGPARLLTELRTALDADDPALRASRLARAASEAWSLGRREDALRWYAESVRLGAGAPVRAEFAARLAETGRPLGAAALSPSPAR